MTQLGAAAVWFIHLFGWGGGTPVFFNSGNNADNSNNLNTVICSTQYETVYSTVYDTVLVKKCFPGVTESCKQRSKTVTKPVKEKSCSTETEKVCEKENETVYESSCTSHTEKSCTYVYDTHYTDKCKTVYKKICDNGSDGYSRADHTDFDRVDGPSVDQFNRRGSSHHTGYGYGCKKVPIEKCEKIPERIPRQECTKIPKPTCQTKPKQISKVKCRQVPKEVCRDTVRMEESSEPEEKCEKVEVEKCARVPRKVPRRVPHRIPRHQCQPVSGQGPGTGYQLVGVIGGNNHCGGGYSCG